MNAIALNWNEVPRNPPPKNWICCYLLDRTRFRYEWMNEWVWSLCSGSSWRLLVSMMWADLLWRWWLTSKRLVWKFWKLKILKRYTIAYCLLFNWNQLACYWFLSWRLEKNFENLDANIPNGWKRNLLLIIRLKFKIYNFFSQTDKTKLLQYYTMILYNIYKVCPWSFV